MGVKMADTAPTDLTVEGLLAATEAEFGDRLDDEGRATVRRQIERIVENSRVLSAYALTNGQEPDFVFTARREG